MRRPKVAACARVRTPTSCGSNIDIDLTRWPHLSMSSRSGAHGMRTPFALRFATLPPAGSPCRSYSGSVRWDARCHRAPISSRRATSTSCSGSTPKTLSGALPHRTLHLQPRDSPIFSYSTARRPNFDVLVLYYLSLKAKRDDVRTPTPPCREYRTTRSLRPPQPVPSSRCAPGSLPLSPSTELAGGQTSRSSSRGMRCVEIHRPRFSRLSSLAQWSRVVITSGASRPSTLSFHQLHAMLGRNCFGAAATPSAVRWNWCAAATASAPPDFTVSDEAHPANHAVTVPIHLPPSRSQIFSCDAFRDDAIQAARRLWEWGDF